MNASKPIITTMLILLFAFTTGGRLYAQDDDWGDAPDAYNTTTANNGAVHLSAGMALYMGASVDTESNGQPTAAADGDDLNGFAPDDEDGVIFNSLLIPGQTANIDVLITMLGPPQGWLDILLDADNSGDWTGPNDLIYSAAVTPGLNQLSIPLPAGTLPGQNYMRFRLNPAVPLPPAGPAQDGEVEDYAVVIQEVYPHKMHWAQYPDPNGWDVRACYSDLDGKRKVLADDFQCTSNGLINQIIFWGSWSNDLYVANEEFQGITNIHLSLHSDIPDPDPQNPEDFSKPEVPALWEKEIDPNNPPLGWAVTVTPEEPSWQGWYDPNTETWVEQNHMQYFRYEVIIPTNEAFEQVEGTIYWLDISMQTQEGLWGWKTSASEHYMDDAVWSDLPVENTNQWNELRDPVTDESLDLAFVINQKELEVDWGDAPDQPYPTLSVNTGASHTILIGMYLGAGVDGEPDGQQDPQALGDDQNINGLGGIPFLPGDEDGVTLTSLVPGLPATITAIASAPGVLDAWIDYNANGVWEASEKLGAGTLTLLPGVNNFNIVVPTAPAAIPTLSTFARFRYSSAGGLTTMGPAQDGEVEDYEITIDDPIDWGDAPDPTYPTLAASMGASHLIGGPSLGFAVDPEFDGQPSALADGDDLDPQGDDEDGVTFKTLFYPGAVAQIDVQTFNSGLLNIWIDFNANGSWLDAGEQVFTDLPLTTGPNALTIPVPVGLTATNTFMRVRYSTVPMLQPTGYAGDGEVEDYMITIEEAPLIDWGDCPDAPYYPTVAINNGAHHLIQSGMFLGNQIDPEPDGQPNPNADGDDINGVPNDEDGVILTTKLMPGGYASVDVTASQAGILDAWIDFGNDGSWGQLGDQIFSGQPLSAGVNTLPFPVPLVPLVAPTNQAAYARFRFTSGPGAYPRTVTWSGLALDGEVEDYEYLLIGIEKNLLDYGDAPDSNFNTLLASQGASHMIAAGVMLGSTVDSESDGQPTFAADGDDSNTGFPPPKDDEDGVTFLNKLVAGSNATIKVVAGVSGGYLDAWIDFNGNGAWSAGEHLFGGSPVLLSGGATNFVFTVPQPSTVGPTYSRFRITTGSGGLPPDNATLSGGPPDGEVEDYVVNFYQPHPTTGIVITNLTFDASNTVATVEWTVESGILYQMQATTNLVISNSWVDVEAPVAGPLNSQTNDISAEPAKFYRVTAPWLE